MNENLYSNGLHASGRDLSNDSENIKELLSCFEQANSNFKLSMEQLKNYWSGADYDSMKANINTKMDPITSTDGSIQTMMKKMIEELDQTARDYSSIQRNNESYWG